MSGRMSVVRTSHNIDRSSTRGLRLAAIDGGLPNDKL